MSAIKVTITQEEFQALNTSGHYTLDCRDQVADQDDPYSIPGVEWTIFRNGREVLHGWNSGTQPGRGEFGNVWLYTANTKARSIAELMEGK